MFQFTILAIAKVIEEATVPKDPESRRMKRQIILRDPWVGEVYPKFPQEGAEGAEGQPSSTTKSKFGAFKLDWGGQTSSIHNGQHQAHP